jgi:Predicted dehydrogenases and related proteins
MNKTINWGILGLGGIAEKFAQGMTSVPNARLYAVGSRSTNKAKSFANKYNAVNAYGTYEELASDPLVDVIYIATPHVLHCENTLMCIQKGKAVLCEKPFAMNEKEVLRMISLAKEKNIFLMEAMWTRFLPTISKTMELIRKGVIGDVIHLKSDFGNKSHYDPKNRFFNIELGGGSLLDIGIYPVFIALLLLGEPDEVSAEAIIGKTGVDENISAVFKYNSGKLATLFSTFLTNSPVETDIYGTKGYIRINRMWHIPSSLTLVMRDGHTENINFEYKNNGYDFEAIEVTNCLLKGKKESSIMPLDFSLKLIKLFDKLRKICNIKYSMD